MLIANKYIIVSSGTKELLLLRKRVFYDHAVRIIKEILKSNEGHIQISYSYCIGFEYWTLMYWRHVLVIKIDITKL